jgi:hypothetical protein
MSFIRHFYTVLSYAALFVAGEVRTLMGGREDDSLSEDDAVFTDSDGERLDYSGSSGEEATEHDEEEEAVETDEDEAVGKRRKVQN